MKSRKPSKVFIKPYDKWNRRLDSLAAIGLVLIFITFFYHPLWLTALTSISFFVNILAYLGLLVLNARKKRKLSKINHDR
ncbi:hypothetical protein HC026_07450 [Lactobacillus sp. LC28-10]|uniref:Uncharacterized protein n=1 Tax=Secundilactobacillus angelensis TaxID=2722706 RepID=A0ABX1KZW9_9LACO|nr:hypothetical protein [Secundilactobacillus angelensis]MCH5462861.1 hypothetical protein [Secundilactobacillus angelensis]NLR18760.1 hypothetical protein [Secundilactobacillus angelensis]